MSSADTSRISYETFKNRQPGAYEALITLGNSATEGGLDKALAELIKLRVSQINGCAFCLQLHLNIARKLGIERAKLDLLATWHDAGVFSEREAAALAWAEALTRLSGVGVSDVDWAAVREHFSEEETELLTITIGTINTWNRIAGPFRFTPLVPARETV
ncbi:carboxymuconolactone decarboxylase family protein [uncultured Roseibium sp.]|uniref:carboxymuconolactone decarboxylase family protein n=1 Tax=uncultured Roseibium sp. TaxID=1936171 RepID=UPI0032180C2A